MRTSLLPEGGWGEDAKMRNDREARTRLERNRPGCNPLALRARCKRGCLSSSHITDKDVLVPSVDDCTRSKRGAQHSAKAALPTMPRAENRSGSAPSNSRAPATMHISPHRNTLL